MIMKIRVILVPMTFTILIAIGIKLYDINDSTQFNNQSDVIMITIIIT